MRTAPAVAAAIASVAALLLSGACILDGEGAFGPDRVLGPPTSNAGGQPGTGGVGGMSSGGAGGMAGGGAPPNCGDGAVDTDEDCDDRNAVASDGCTSCRIDQGYECEGAPSNCTRIPPQVMVVGPGLGLTIPDSPNYYNGTTSTMLCTNIVVPNNNHPSIQSVVLTVGIDHVFVGDLIIKLVSPRNTIATLMSRPGYAEPSDTYDSMDNGWGAAINSAYQVTFDDTASADAENMGSGIPDAATVCLFDAICSFRSNPGSATGNGLSDFDGENPAGGWRLCVGDGINMDSGTLQSATLTVLSW